MTEQIISLLCGFEIIVVKRSTTFWMEARYFRSENSWKNRIFPTEYSLVYWTVKILTGFGHKEMKQQYRFILGNNHTSKRLQLLDKNLETLLYSEMLRSNMKRFLFRLLKVFIKWTIVFSLKMACIIPTCIIDRLPCSLHYGRTCPD